MTTSEKEIKLIQSITTVSEIKKYCQKTSINMLQQIQLFLDDLYYNTDNPAISDQLYDVFKEYIQKNTSSSLPVGAEIPSHSKRASLPYYMGSIDKITVKDQKVLDRWGKKNSSSHQIITSKLDGISGLLVYNGNTSTKKLYTRGNGIIGADISHLIPYISSIPKSITKKSLTIRGELIINKLVFSKKHQKNYKNSRNMVAGLVGSKTLRKGIEDIQFIAYEIIKDTHTIKPSFQLKKLQKYGFSVALNKKVKSVNNIQDLIELHKYFKSKTDFDIDGIVIQSNVIYDRNTNKNPSYSFAFKMIGDTAETLVKDIEWSVSAHGQIIPIALVEPRNLCGCTISRISLSNASKMEKLGVGPGAKVIITRSNDVIPFILKVIQKSPKLKMPEIKHKWDANHVHLNIELEKVSQDIKDTVEIKSISSFFSKMSIKYVSIATIKKIYNQGYHSIIDIIAITKEELLQIEGIKEKSALRIIANINKGLQQVNPSQLIGYSGVLGYGIGFKKVEALMIDFPDIFSDIKMSPEDISGKIQKIDGFSEKTCSKILKNLSRAKIFLNKIKQFSIFSRDIRVSNDLVGMKFVLTGFRSKKLEEEISTRGGKISSSVSKKTKGIIVPSLDFTSNKVNKARELNVPIFLEHQFRKNYLFTSCL